MVSISPAVASDELYRIIRNCSSTPWTLRLTCRLKVTWSALPEVAEAILLVEKCPPLLALDVEEVDDLARRGDSVSETRV
jgi:hypothetical protein